MLGDYKAIGKNSEKKENRTGSKSSVSMGSMSSKRKKDDLYDFYDYEFCATQYCPGEVKIIHKKARYCLDCGTALILHNGMEKNMLLDEIYPVFFDVSSSHTRVGLSEMTPRRQTDHYTAIFIAFVPSFGPLYM